MKEFNVLPELKPNAKPMSWIMTKMIGSVGITKKLCERMITSERGFQPKNDKVKVKTIHYKGYNGDVVSMLCFTPDGVSENARCLVNFHGGAFQLEGARYQLELACEYAIKANCKVFFVIYRTASFGAFPMPFEDCYLAVKELWENASRYGIDKENIVVSGDSAGGCIGAGVAIKCRDNGIKLKAQMLIYPILDDECKSESTRKYWIAPVWGGRGNKKVYKNYIRDGVAPEQLGYAVPLKEKNLEDVTQAYIEVNEIDSLHDDGVVYGKALIEHSVPVELYENIGCYHGFEAMLDTNIVKEVTERRAKYLNKVFAE